MLINKTVGIKSGSNSMGPRLRLFYKRMLIDNRLAKSIRKGDNYYVIYYTLAGSPLFKHSEFHLRPNETWFDA